MSHREPPAIRAFAAMVALAVVVTLASCAPSKPDGPPSVPPSAGATSKPSPAGPRTSAAGSARRPITVVGVGDSVTAGSNCDCQAFVALYATDLASARGMRTSSINLGAPGWATPQLLARLTQPGTFREEVATADILLVTIGANDLTPLEAKEPGGCTAACYAPLVDSVGQNVELIVGAARAARPDHPPTILVTNYWNVFQDGDVGTAENGAAFQSWSDALTRAANAQICQGAQQAGATCVDLYRPFKQGGSKNPTSLLAADGDHPNSAGHQLIASTLLASTPPWIP